MRKAGKSRIGRCKGEYHVVLGILCVGPTTETIQHRFVQRKKICDTRIFVICGVACVGVREAGNVKVSGLMLYDIRNYRLQILINNTFRTYGNYSKSS